MSVPEALALVRRLPAAFRESYPPRLVNNFYFDSPGLTDYHDHLDGAPNRVKTRVRWYGEANGHIPDPVLERKLKRGTVSGKLTHPLPSLSSNGDAARRLLESACASAHMPELWRLTLQQLEPSLFNQYLRHYFVSANRHFRLTIDSELRFGPLRSSCRKAELLASPLVILELKFPPQHAQEAPFITSTFPFRLVRCSKYVLGLEHT